VPGGAGWSPASIDRQPFSGHYAAVGVTGWIGLVCHLVVQAINRQLQFSLGCWQRVCD
jgi:hypothetical protein